MPIVSIKDPNPQGTLSEGRRTEQSNP
jgi:hypothetical protein